MSKDGGMSKDVALVQVTLEEGVTFVYLKKSRYTKIEISRLIELDWTY